MQGSKTSKMAVSGVLTLTVLAAAMANARADDDVQVVKIVGAKEDNGAYVVNRSGGATKTDMVAVFHEGRISGIVNTRESSQEEIMHLASGRVISPAPGQAAVH